MLDKLKAGEINVELRPMTALDQGQEGHSTKALAAELALIANGDLAQAFSLRDYLFQNQQSAYNKYDNDGFADLARDYGASDDAAAPASARTSPGGWGGVAPVDRAVRPIRSRVRMPPPRVAAMPVAKAAKKRIKQLERELRRKDAALAETAALLVLRKKAEALWGKDEDE